MKIQRLKEILNKLEKLDTDLDISFLTELITVPEDKIAFIEVEQGCIDYGLHLDENFVMEDSIFFGEIDDQIIEYTIDGERVAINHTELARNIFSSLENVN